MRSSRAFAGAAMAPKSRNSRSSLDARRMRWRPRRKLHMDSLGSGGAEADSRYLALGRRVNFKELAGLETGKAGDDVRRELLNFCVQVAHDCIVITARVLQRVLD